MFDIENPVASLQVHMYHQATESATPNRPCHQNLLHYTHCLFKFFQSFTPLRPLSLLREGKTYPFSIDVHGIFRFRIALGSCPLTSLMSLDINPTEAHKIVRCSLLLYGFANYHSPQRYHQTSLSIVRNMMLDLILPLPTTWPF